MEEEEVVQKKAPVKKGKGKNVKQKKVEEEPVVKKADSEEDSIP